MLRLSQSVKSKLLIRNPKMSHISDYFNDSDLLSLSKSLNNVDYIWSRDPKKLSTYRKIINELYSEDETSETNYSSTYTETDYRSAFLLVLPQNYYAGGCHVTVNDPLQLCSLPCEADGFSLQKGIPELNFTKHRVAEISRFSIKSELDQAEYYDNSFRMIQEFLTSAHVRYMVIRASVSKQKLYYRYARQYFNLILQKDFETNDSLNQEYYFCVYENPNFRG